MADRLERCFKELYGVSMEVYRTVQYHAWTVVQVRRFEVVYAPQGICA